MRPRLRQTSLSSRALDALRPALAVLVVAVIAVPMVGGLPAGVTGLLRAAGWEGGLLSAARDPEDAGKTPPAPAHGDHFVTQAEFGAAVAAAPRIAAGLGDPCVAAVVPHHAVAGRLPAALFARLSADPPSILVIVGPDHFRAGPKIGTSAAAWQTAEGPVGPDVALVGALSECGLAAEDWSALEGEHSVGALMPYVRHYLPATKVVPLTLRGDVSLTEAAALGRFLARWAETKAAPAGDGEDGVFVVASVDFSHYLGRVEAGRHDAVTVPALERGEWGTLFELGPNYLDSPASLAAAFAFAGSLDRPSFTVAAHTNSADLLGRPDLTDTTSHFLLLVP